MEFEKDERDKRELKERKRRASCYRKRKKNTEMNSEKKDPAKKTKIRRKA